MSDPVVATDPVDGAADAAGSGGRADIHARLVEILLSLAVVASFGWTAYFFVNNGYLPQPFVFDTNDTFMDWFNTAYWANHPGAYSVWRTIYPPLSFAFLDIVSLPGCYRESSFFARDCDWLARGAIYGFYLLDVALVWLAMRRADRRTAPMRTAAFALGLPLLFTLERGNLILVAFACFVLAYGGVARSRWIKALAIAATINFKPYLLLPALGHAVKREWRALELAGFATVALYLVTLAMVGGGSPMEIVSNTANWVVFQSGQIWGEIYFSTSYAPLLLLRTAPIPVLEFVPSKLVDTIEMIVPIAIRAAQAAALTALVAAWVQPRAIPGHRVSALLLAAYLVTQSPGGYTQTFLVFLVMLEPFRRPGPIVAIVSAYILCLVGEWPFSVVLEVSSNSWLGERPVNPVFAIGLGQFLRPGLVMLILWGLAFDTVVQAAKAHRIRRPSLWLAAA